MIRTRAGNICANAGLVSCVGYFVENGLHVSSWHGNRSDNVGLGASRNSYLVSENQETLSSLEGVSLGK